ncbi:hypothetical protein I6N90_00025 [Paenibacillus sp. GSMTC-2017]|uniref:hypothetical protein n=1 Tax=Paenibacillus sp. GSMTC-2017 TaxID=2794350 RepID=UPI0018D9FF3E|nr:hypothetical protein [Paenibacillus sp. GSMTC-2017]MBH5316193.1 hypothetical protein [Paenibacillus sp. GSMTC-2017]
MKKILIVIGVLVGVFAITSLSGFHLTKENAIPGDVKLLQSIHIDKDRIAVIYKDNMDGTYGVSKLNKKFGLLYQDGGGAYGYFIEEGKPFQAMGSGTDKDSIVAVITPNNSTIKYIAVGNYMEEVTPFDKYELSLNDVKSNSEKYMLQEVINNHVLFVKLGMFTEDFWTIRAFDKDGKLIADKLFGMDARYINWQ